MNQMASIRKIEGKNGVSYKITVTKGRDLNGRQVRHYLTWTPEPKMTPRQIEKAVQKAAFTFEQEIEKGFAVDNRQTFSEYARYVIHLKEHSGKKRRTIESYTDLLRRIDPATATSASPTCGRSTSIPFTKTLRRRASAAR